MWQGVACSIDLEGRPRHLARAVWIDGRGGEQLAEWLDNHKHGTHSRAAERLQLVFRLACQCDSDVIWYRVSSRQDQTATPVQIILGKV